MSATLPRMAAANDRPSAPVARRPWPRFSVSLGGSVLEVRGATVFLRSAGVEAYLYAADVSDWWTLREPGSFDAAAGRLRFTAARASTRHAD